MIVVGLMGGLGNQLFQYCTGRRLALKLGTDLALDPSFLQEDRGPRITPRPYMLDRFNITGKLMNPDEVRRFVDGGLPGYRLALNSVSNRFVGRRVFRRPRMFIERDKNFEPDVLTLPDDRYLFGYFQSDRYFKDVRETVVQELTVKEPMNEANARIARKILESSSVCLHVRRGDYITNQAANRILGVDLSDYYQEAVRIMRKRHDGCRFFIFSDEPDWVRRNLDLGERSTIVDINPPDRAEQDLRLMSMCKHFIIANSSFSWWGAWLSTYPGKTVIAPKRWFLDDRNVKDRCPEEWTRL